MTEPATFAKVAQSPFAKAPQSRKPLHVLLTTEGTYPYVRGGVSTWCDTLVRGVPDVTFTVLAVVGHPFYPLRYRLPAGVTVLKVPLWGTESAADHLQMPYSVLFERRERTTETVVRADFLPLFDELLTLCASPAPDGIVAGRVFHRLYRLFQTYDYDRLWKSNATWEYFVAGLSRGRWRFEGAPGAAGADGTAVAGAGFRSGGLPSLHEALQILGWLYRFLLVLQRPVPLADVVHSSAAAFCGLPAVIAKLERNTPYLLTEHGVYLREHYLSLARADLAPGSRQFLSRLIQTVVAANYAHADLVAPVCAFNSRWEQQFGVPRSRIRITYNGVDADRFVPRSPPAGQPPTVITVARLDPAKDIMTLLRAAAIVRRSVPDVQFVVYGGISSQEYARSCHALRAELGLEQCFSFAGHSEDVAAAYAKGHVVALSSITEGFPYAVVEAMMSGRPVVATDVGGTREAVGETGLLVPPRQPAQMAAAIVLLLRQPALRDRLAAAARTRALTYFSESGNLARYRQAYAELASEATPVPEAGRLLRQRQALACERAVALAELGRWQEAAGESRLATSLDSASPLVSLALWRQAVLHGQAGDQAAMRRELERLSAWLQMQTSRPVA